MKATESSAISKERLLAMYSKLIDGKPIYKQEEAIIFGVSERSIQRDIEDLRLFFDDQQAMSDNPQQLKYDRKEKCYRLEPPLRNLLDMHEVFAVLKILLESRALTKTELFPIIDKLIDCCLTAENKAVLKELIGNEKYHYVELQHKTEFLNNMWQLSGAVKNHLLTKLSYQKKDGTIVERLVKPVGIMFSEFYFYLTAFICPGNDQHLCEAIADDPFPTVYRIDRIKSFEITDDHFRVPYEDRFEEGEFRKRVQFMFPGRLKTIRFWYRGSSLEAVLDRLPTAKVIKKDETGWLISAEVFGEGIDMWLRTHGDKIELVTD